MQTNGKNHTHNGNGARDVFHRFATKASIVVGSPWAFILAVVVILAWGITGPMFKFSDTWQLVINTGTTIVTFLMVFLIQNTQNRDARAIHLKLDELIRALKGARNKLVDLEEWTEDELGELEQEFHRLRKQRGKERQDAHAEEHHDEHHDEHRADEHRPGPARQSA